MMERAQAPHDQKRALRERVQVESLEHQLRVVAHMLMRPESTHSVGSLCSDLENSHEDGLVLHHNIYLLVANKKLKHVREISGLSLTD